MFYISKENDHNMFCVRVCVLQLSNELMMKSHVYVYVFKWCFIREHVHAHTCECVCVNIFVHLQN